MSPNDRELKIERLLAFSQSLELFNRAPWGLFNIDTMNTAFYAGGDWSGEPNQPDEPFIFCVVTMGDAEAWNDSCRQLRKTLRWAQNREFHGYKMKDDVQRLQVLRMGRAAGMRVGALILTANTRALEKRAPSYQSIALELLDQFFARAALRMLWCDTEIEGEEAQKTFETALQHCHRKIHPDARFEARVRKSHTSNLIQLADVMAYTLRTQAMGKVKNPASRQFLKEMTNDQANLIISR